ncbi:hypothetical protein [Halovivax cerinus]|uniref:Uncharacterized protein n=1 Tax=Halovivax cerinus TaxID=1487865 RepID=A0ABD5NNW5_9EURY|nr:hypothetical protein [Halovivax cerinus]
MPLALRLYDSDGAEIAKVTADPYEFEITHPDAGWDGLRHSLSVKADGVEQLPGESVTVDGVTLPHERFAFHERNPKNHLEYVRENVQYHSDVGSVSLIDE